MSEQSRLHNLCSTSCAAERDCLAHFRKGDFIVLVDAGAGLLADLARLQPLLARTDGCLAVAAADAEVLGLAGAVRRLGLTSIDDRAWVGMLEAHGQVLSWK